jgi:hypothetical protein
LINFWSKLNIGITLFSRKWWKLVDIFGQYIIQVSFFEFMSNICCFDLFPFNLFTPKTKYVMLWLKRIKDQIVEKKYFEQEFYQILTIFFQIKCFRRLQFFFWNRDCVNDIDENSIECDEFDQKIKLKIFWLFFEFMSNFLTFSFFLLLQS